MRVMPGKRDVLADIIPVDVVAKFALTVPWFITQKAAAGQVSFYLLKMFCKCLYL